MFQCLQIHSWLHICPRITGDKLLVCLVYIASELHLIPCLQLHCLGYTLVMVVILNNGVLFSLML